MLKTNQKGKSGTHTRCSQEKCIGVQSNSIIFSVGWLLPVISAAGLKEQEPARLACTVGSAAVFLLGSLESDSTLDHCSLPDLCHRPPNLDWQWTESYGAVRPPGSIMRPLIPLQKRHWESLVTAPLRDGSLQESLLLLFEIKKSSSFKENIF